MDFTLTADENGELAVDFPGEFAQDPHKLVRQNPVRGDFSPVELFDPPELSGPEAREVAIDAMDVSDLRLCGTKCRGYRVSGLGFRVKDVPQF